MWIRGKTYYNESIEEICIEFDRIIRNVKKECKPDITLPTSTLLIPGAIDMHVHVRGAQLSYKETVITATSEAVYGGITLIVDMPNTVPPINTYERVIERIREFENYSRTDFGIYAGVGKDTEKIENLPIAGYKIYPEDLEKEELDTVLRSKKLKVIHSEIPKVNKLFRKIRNANIWMEIAPIRMLSGTNNLHVTHITNYYTLKLAKELGMTTDITLHHLLVDGERNCMTKVNPPIRDYLTRIGMLSALFEVDAIASDHAPHALWEKSQHIELCPPGIAMISFTVPFLFSLVKRDVINIGHVINLISKNPAKILNVRYGRIEKGYFANFTVIKFERWRYSTKYSKVTQTPLDGYPLDAMVYMTIVQGKVVYEDGEVYPVRGINPFDQGSRKGI